MDMISRQLLQKTSIEEEFPIKICFHECCQIIFCQTRTFTKKLLRIFFILSFTIQRLRKIQGA